MLDLNCCTQPKSTAVLSLNVHRTQSVLPRSEPFLKLYSNVSDSVTKYHKRKPHLRLDFKCYSLAATNVPPEQGLYVPRPQSVLYRFVAFLKLYSIVHNSMGNTLTVPAEFKFECTVEDTKMLRVQAPRRLHCTSVVHLLPPFFKGYKYIYQPHLNTRPRSPLQPLAKAELQL